MDSSLMQWFLLRQCNIRIGYIVTKKTKRLKKPLGTTDQYPSVFTQHNTQTEKTVYCKE